MLLSPYAPHVAEELWEQLGHTGTLAYHPWPVHDPALLVETTVNLPVQACRLRPAGAACMCYPVPGTRIVVNNTRSFTRRET